MPSPRYSSISHLDSRNMGYVRMLFIDFISIYSSAFNTIVPHQTGWQADWARTEQPPVRLDPGFPDRQAPGHQGGQTHTSKPLTLDVSSDPDCTPCTLYTKKTIFSHNKQLQQPLNMGSVHVGTQIKTHFK